MVLGQPGPILQGFVQFQRFEGTEIVIAAYPAFPKSQKNVFFPPIFVT